MGSDTPRGLQAPWIPQEAGVALDKKKTLTAAQSSEYVATSALPPAP